MWTEWIFAERRTGKTTIFLNGFFSTFWKGLTEYGTSPFRFGFFLVLIFGIAFPSLYLYFQVVESTGSIPAPVDSFITCLYFSIITATTLGYGDYHPIGSGVFISVSEVLLGLVFFGLLVQMFIRRIR